MCFSNLFVNKCTTLHTPRVPVPPRVRAAARPGPPTCAYERLRWAEAAESERHSGPDGLALGVRPRVRVLGEARLARDPPGLQAGTGDPREEAQRRGTAGEGRDPRPGPPSGLHTQSIVCACPVLHTHEITVKRARASTKTWTRTPYSHVAARRGGKSQGSRQISSLVYTVRPRPAWAAQPCVKVTFPSNTHPVLLRRGVPEQRSWP